MLSAPAKSARRISSLFALKSRDSAAQSDSPSPDLGPTVDHRRNGSSSHVSPRHVSSPAAHPSDIRPTAGLGNFPVPDDLSALPPPPPLVAINQDLADDGAHNPQARGRRSLSLSRPSSLIGLLPSRPSSRAGSPEAGKRGSLVSGKHAQPSASPMEARSANPDAWIAGLNEKVPYDLGPLVRGEPIEELWNEHGDTYVYLFPKFTQPGASFKVDSAIFADSPSLNYMARGTDPKMEALQQSTQNLTVTDSDGMPERDQWADQDWASTASNRMAMIEESETQELHLYLPIPFNSDVTNRQNGLSPEDIDSLLLYRNLFAFLLGQALISTPRFPSLFSILLEVSELLRRFEFSNLDGSTFGEVATTSFANYCDELQLADVRKSREKTIEAIVLGEKLRYFPLFQEGFVHGVGKMSDLRQLRSPKYDLISTVTQKRLERGYIDLENRLKVMRGKLEDFDFPSLFAGIANSNSAAENKVVRFKMWKQAFMAMRKHVMGFYRQKYGSWPPKAKSKKNDFEESGLNRLLLKEVYEDFCNLYDILADRTQLTTRTTDMASEDLDVPDPVEAVYRGMRRMMSEYDRSTPPVQPPIPFDVPQLPSLSAVFRKPLDPKQEAKERTKKLADSDINAILMASYSRESLRPTDFVESFMQFERRSAHGKCLDELIDNRIGQWLFLYAVIQSLPLLVMDAPDLRHTQGVEYFLCVAPRGGAPWVQNDSKTGRSWFGVAGGQGVVSLPSDVVTNGVEGVYRRSHCWQVAEQWAEKSVTLNSPITSNEDAASLFSSPTPAPQSSIGSTSDMLSPGGTSPINGPRTNSPGLLTAGHRGSIHPGLEALPLPAGVMPVEPPSKPFVRHNPTMSFDDILKDIPNGKKR